MARIATLVVGLIAVALVGAAAWRWKSPTPSEGAPEPAYENLEPPFGQVIADTDALRDIHANSRQLSEFGGHKAVVLCFLGTGCPLANRSVPSVRRLEQEFREQGVQFCAVYSNAGETLGDVAAHALDYRIEFCVLKDFEQQLADALGVTRTPTYCVLDENLALVYRGRLNDRFGVNYTHDSASREDLELAIEQLLAGQRVEVHETVADGCLIDRYRPPAVEGEVTFAEHVGPLLQRHCETCHREESMAPFALSTYDDAVQWSEMIKEVVFQRRMPPWHADPRYGDFKNDLLLPQNEIDTIIAWVDSGMPSGDLSQFEPSDWSEEWLMGDPDAIVQAGHPTDVPAEGVLPYQYVWVPEEVTDEIFDRERWMLNSEVHPTSPEVVHHLFVYSVDPGEPGPEVRYQGCRCLGIFVPGTASMPLPPDAAIRIPAGSRICFEIHYTPTGKPAADQPFFGLKFTDHEPEKELVITLLETRRFELPPGDPHYRYDLKGLSPADGELVGMFPHMHLRGKTIEYRATFPDGKVEKLLSIPRWDFYWQRIYWLDEPLPIPRGTKISMTAYWDNSESSIRNPDPEAKVVWGRQTTDEMFIGWLIWTRES